jgi:histidine decarboxylase
MLTENNDRLVAAASGETQTVLTDLLARFTAAKATNLGFPAATDLDLDVLAPFLNFMVNNLGDPTVDGAYPIHTKVQEREVVATLADLLRAPAGDRWGYVTSGASEGTEHALWLARTRHPDAIVYLSRAAHHCVGQAIDRLAMTSVVIRTDAGGQIDYDDLTDQVIRHRDRAVIVVANIGTAITEAVDDVCQITTVLDSLAIDRRWVHADAALSGIPLAFIAPAERPGFDFADGADSIIVSGHKFLGSPVPCGVLIVRDSLRGDGGRVTYTGSPNTTLTNSRSGLAALVLWFTLHQHGPNLTRRAQDCRDLADYACQRLTGIGVPAWRHPHAFTVVLPTPPPAVTGKWVLADHDGVSHIMCLPGVTRQSIDDLVADIAATQPPKIPAQRTRRLLRPRPTAELAAARTGVTS